MNSGNKIIIEEFEEHDNVTFYTIRYTTVEQSETEIFFDELFDKPELEEDLEIISKVLDKIGAKGAKDKYFRNAGSLRDRLGALPEYVYTDTKVRLYAIKLSENIVILGNGGIKTTRSYNEDKTLDGYVETLKSIDRFLRSRMQSGKINVYNKQIFGDLIFHL